MDLDREQESRNIEDRRGRRVSRGIAGGGIGTFLIILLALFFGFDPRMLLQGNVQEVNYPQAPPPQSQPTGTNDEMREFVARVLGSTERTWDQIFQAAGQTYQKPTLVLFSDVVESACGFGQAAAGPFYCGEDQKLYIDLAFYRELRQRFQAPGDFAQAYVIAHEVGHHVQNLLGIMRKVQSLQSRSGEREANALSVRLELQADCLAGIWANHAHRERSILEAGRYRRRTKRGGADRRRSDAKTRAGLRGSGGLYPRQRPTARAVVPSWNPERRLEAMRHLLPRVGIVSFPADDR